MSNLTIYRFGSVLARATIEPDESSEQQVLFMRQDILLLNFSVVSVINWHIGDYCNFMSKLYQVNRLPKRQRVSGRDIQYTLQMESEMYDLIKVEYLFLDSINIINKPVFPLRGKLRDFADLIIYNMKRVFPAADWKLGQVEDSDYQTLSFSGENCLQVLQKLAQAFNTEYIVDGKTINIYQRQVSANLVLEYGQDKPLLNLVEESQDASNIITRLYAVGSTKNISTNYRGGLDRLVMGEASYIEKNVDLYGMIEATVIFDGTNGTEEIYPHRTGNVTAIGDKFTIFDTGIDFDLNDYKITDVDPLITFNTGLLSGYTFKIASFNFSTKQIVFNLNSDDPNFIIPSDSFKPQVGDTYVITDIEQPDSYNEDAEARLRLAAQNYLDLHSIPPLVYSGACNPKWFKDKNRSFQLCDSVQVKDDEMGINTIKRITGFNRKVTNIFDVSLELSDTVKPKSILVQLLNGL